MKTFKIKQPIQLQEIVAVQDKGEVEMEFAVMNGQIYISGPDYGLNEMDSEDLKNSCLSKEDSIALAKYLYENIVGKKKCN